ncbi:MAG TPA: fatty acid--CoA ligase [Acetobacteraceae bacterium]|nr:fatty acid--CoA ligase [Acetobacteraceae bacterium]
MSAYQYPLLIKQLLAAPIARRSGEEIIFRDRLRYDYPTLAARVGRLGSALTALGVRQGDVVGVMDWDSHRYLESFFAIPMLGATLMTVNIRLAPEQIAYTINHAEVTVLFCHTDFLPVLRAIRGELPKLRTVIVLTDSAEVPAEGVDGEYEALLATGDPAHEFPDFDEGTRATTFYTTGTTGLPKGVYFSHRQLVLHTLSVLVALTLPGTGQGISDRDVYMPLTPMFHVHAWGFPYAATMAGMKQVYPGRYQPDVIVRLVRDEKVSVSHCVPTILQMVLAAADEHKVDLSGWKVVIGGSALPKALAQAALDRGVNTFTGYGMSETCPVLSIAHLRPEMIGDKAAELDARTKAGLPVPLVDLRIVDHDMQSLPRDGVATGEIVARAPWLTQGYTGNPEASEELWEGGYLHTKDIGRIRPDGYLEITDRIKDVIKTGGEWVSSLQLEDIILQVPCVAEVAVIGIKDERWGERPLVLAVPRQGMEIDPEAIRAHVASYADKKVLPRYAIPENILVVESLARTSVGKLDKKALRAMYGAQFEVA